MSGASTLGKPSRGYAATRPLATLPLAGSDVALVAVEGTLQLLWFDAGWPEGAPGSLGRPWFNRFCTPATPAELRALADAVERNLVRVAK